MRTDYVRELKENYLRIISDNEIDYGMKILIGQNLPGFLKLSERKINGECHFLYKISSKMNMKDAFVAGGMSSVELMGLIKSFGTLFEIMDSYLMDYNSIILAPEFIWKEVGSDEWSFVYYSGKEGLFEEELKVLFEYIIKIVNHKDTKAVTMAYGIYKRICEENINLSSVFEFETTDKEEGEVIKEYHPIESVIPEVVIKEVEEPDYKKIYGSYIVVALYGVVALYFLMGIFFHKLRISKLGMGVYVVALLVMGVIGYLAYDWYNKNKSWFNKITQQKTSVPFEKENVRIIVPRENVKEENPTVLLDETNIGSGHYLRWQEKNGEKRFDIEEKAILIGSAADKVDCVINGRGVSRIHARISCEGKSYYIKDMNSTNGTKIDGRELVCYELCELHTGNRIELGNLECIFV